MTLSLNACTNLTSLLFYPKKHYYQQPEDLGLDVTYVSIPTADGEYLSNWYLDSSLEAKATVLFLHGNGENISTHINSVAWLTQQGYKVFLLDYRGFGLSSGSSTLASALSDIQDTHAWLSENEPLPLILYGQSMGGALAITYVANMAEGLSPVYALASESAPANWPQIARETMRQNIITWLMQIPASLLPDNFDAEKHIGKIDDIPTLVMHSQEDEVVPYHHSKQLLDKGGPQIQFLQTHGSHISGLADPKTRKALVNFFEEAFTRGTNELPETLSASADYSQINTQSHQ